MVIDALKQGRLEELNQKPKRSVSTAPVETLRMPLNEQYLMNKKLARQIFEQELLDKVKLNLTEKQ